MAASKKDRPRYIGRKPKGWNSNDRVAGLVEGLDPGADPLWFIYTSNLDRAQMPEWIEQLREAETNVRLLRHQILALLSGEERHCPICDKAVTGKANRVYCGATCRQRARRRSAGVVE